ncbi:MAG TPA: voltage-gated potassium channel protein [Acidobacteriaceae bacterium]|jgi:voltage-gated potassium channel|nr:voltage-gated potassium channel protein [Acidobacteriaceae bacterium]
MTLAWLQRLRVRFQRLHHALGGGLWFPHVPLALLLIGGGLWTLHARFGWDWQPYFESLIRGDFHVNLKLLPTVLIGGGMEMMGIALLWRSRLAWVVAVLLAVVAAINTALTGHTHVHVLLVYFSLVVVLLLAAWRSFDRSSLAASTLFAITSVIMLLLYATFGSYYLGREFRPAIHDLVTALYYAMVTMSTVGYGDIVPVTPEARLFTLSVIVLGVAIFATSLTAVIAPLVSQSLQRIISRKGTHMKRENHFVVIGNTPLAVNTWRELARRGRPVTRVLREKPEEGQVKEDVDLVVGDPSMTDTLKEAGADKAEAVLAMMADDSENAFCVLAVRELGSGTRTVAAVNDARHLSRVKLVQPDVVIAPQVLGGELTAMLLSGEQVTPEFVMERVFQQKTAEP